MYYVLLYLLCILFNTIEYIHHKPITIEQLHLCFYYYYTTLLCTCTYIHSCTTVRINWVHKPITIEQYPSHPQHHPNREQQHVQRPFPHLAALLYSEDMGVYGCISVYIVSTCVYIIWNVCVYKCIYSTVYSEYIPCVFLKSPSPSK